MTTAEFRKGQLDGVTGVKNVITKVIDGTDHGEGRVADKELEKIRRVLLSWRDFMIENMDKNNYLSKKITDTLVNTKKLMDIKVSN